MARRGFGNLRKLPSGRWQARYRGPDEQTHKAPHTFDTKTDADTWLSMQRADIARGSWRSPEAVRVEQQQAERARVPFGEYAAKWLEQRLSGRGDKGKIKPATGQLYDSMLRVHLLPTFGATPLVEITRPDVKAWYGDMDAETPTARANAYGLLRTIMGAAMDDELIQANPVQIKGAGSKSRARELPQLTRAEFDALANAVPDRYRAFVLLGGWCGLRFGELAELRRSDLDLSKRVVHVRRAITTVGGEVVVGEPKSGSGRRTVPIPASIVPDLKAHRDEHAQFGRDGLLFPAADGKSHLATSTLHRVYKPAAAMAGRPELRVHDLRHFGAIMYARAGATLGELQQRLGHSTAQAALVYQSMVSERGTELTARMDALAKAHTP